MRPCAPPPPPKKKKKIFERLKLPQQIIYRREGNLSESPNHFKYRKNILISRFYEQFLRNSRNLGHFWKFQKISNSENINISYIILKRVIRTFLICFAKNSNFAALRQHFRIFRNSLLLLSSRYLNISRNKLYIFRTSKNGLNFDYFWKIAHKIAKSKYFSDI